MARAYGRKYRSTSGPGSVPAARSSPLCVVRVYTAPIPTASISSRSSGNRSGSTTSRESRFTNRHGRAPASPAATSAIRAVCASVMWSSSRASASSSSTIPSRTSSGIARDECGTCSSTGESASPGRRAKEDGDGDRDVDGYETEEGTDEEADEEADEDVGGTDTGGSRVLVRDIKTIKVSHGTDNGAATVVAGRHDSAPAGEVPAGAESEPRRGATRRGRQFTGTPASRSTWPTGA